MKILNFWMVVLVVLSPSPTFVSYSDDDDDKPSSAKGITGAYRGCSVSAHNMLSDYLLGDESITTIAANEGSTINLVYKSGSGGFALNNLKLSSNKPFDGSGEVAISMDDSTGGSYGYTSEGSIDDSRMLSLKADVDIPVPIGKMEIDPVQGEIPAGYYIKDIYKCQTNLSLSATTPEGDTTAESAEDCKVTTENPTGSTVDVTTNGFNNTSDSMNYFEEPTIKGVNVTKANDGSHSLDIGSFETDTQRTIGEILAVVGMSLSDTVKPNGTATITVAFKPGSIPWDVTADLTGSNTSSVQ